MELFCFVVRSLLCFSLVAIQKKHRENAAVGILAGCGAVGDSRVFLFLPVVHSMGQVKGGYFARISKEGRLSEPGSAAGKRGGNPNDGLCSGIGGLLLCGVWGRSSLNVLLVFSLVYICYFVLIQVFMCLFCAYRAVLLLMLGCVGLSDENTVFLAAKILLFCQK